MVVAGEYGCSEEVVSIVAMLQVQNVFTRPRGQEGQARRAHRKFEVHLVIETTQLFQW